MKKNCERNETLQGVFDVVAKDFESVGPKYFTHFGHALVQGGNVSTGSLILDVACGRGASLFKSAELVGDEGKVIGVDFSSEMLKALLESAKDRGQNNIEVIQMDAENLEFGDHSFDHVFCGLSLHFFSDPLLCIKEMYRVLNVGGKVGLSTWAMKRKTGKKGVYERAFDRVFSNSIRPSSKKEKDTIDYATASGLKKLLAFVGFTHVDVQSEAKVFYYSSKEEWWHEQSNNASRGFFERIKQNDPSRFEAFKAAAFEEVESEMEDGKIRFEANVLYAYAIRQ